MFSSLYYIKTISHTFKFYNEYRQILAIKGNAIACVALSVGFADSSPKGRAFARKLNLSASPSLPPFFWGRWHTVGVTERAESKPVRSATINNPYFCRASRSERGRERDATLALLLSMPYLLRFNKFLAIALILFYNSSRINNLSLKG